MTATPLDAIPARWAQPDPSTTSTLPKGGANLTYMGHAEVTLALIACDPEWNWEPAGINPDTGGPLIRKEGNRLVMWGWLELCGVRRLCVGTCEERKGDPEKELIGDLLRNGAMRFGIGTKLWSRAVDADPFGSGGTGGYDRRPTQAARRAIEPPADGQGYQGGRPSAMGITEPQMTKLSALLNEHGLVERLSAIAYVSDVIGRPVESRKELSRTEAAKVIDALEAEPVPA